MKRTTIAFLALAVFSAAAAAQERLALRDGLVIDPTRNVAYVMQPAGGIAAVDLASGAIRWSTPAADMPLALIGNRLLSQIEPKTAAKNRLQLATLDVREGGAAMVRSDAMNLPQGVRAAAGETREGTFVTRARPAGGSAIVTWNFVPAPVKSGMLPPPGEAPPAAAFDAGRRETSGTVRINLATGATSAVSEVSAATAMRAEKTWVIPASALDASPSTQYESADGRHLLTSERVADDRTWEKYRWTVFERETGRKVGETRSHVSFTPFVVRDSAIIFETTPFIRGGQSEPAKLRSESLETGTELWGVPVRELVFRGPYPP